MRQERLRVGEKKRGRVGLTEERKGGRIRKELVSEK